MHTKIRYTENKYIENKKLFLKTTTKELITSTTALSLLALIIFTVYNIIVEIRQLEFSEDKLSFQVLAGFNLIVFLPAFLYFVMMLYKIMTTVLKIIFHTIFKKKFIYNESSNEIDIPSSNDKERLDTYMYEINMKNVDLYFMRKTDEEAVYKLINKVSIEINCINENDFDAFISILEKNKVDLPQSARDEIIHNSSASELEMEEKIKKHGPQKKISSILLVPYAPTIAYITICLVVVFITPISIIAGLLSFIVRGVPALIARTGVLLTILIPIGVLIAVIFLIKFIWVRV